MKKLSLLFIVTVFLVGCEQAPKQAPANSKMETFNTNVATTKAFLSSFMENDSITFFSDKYIGKDFMWSPPAVGMDSLPRVQWEGAFKGFMVNYDNKMLMDAQYYAALNEKNLPDGNVRVYGTWNSTFAETGKKSMLKWYAVFRYDSEGKIAHYMEWYDSADLSKEFD
tara:strand:- start:210 stop:713 length:504 start_codon:yes stop_codon:yes gene_type:complete